MQTNCIPASFVLGQSPVPGYGPIIVLLGVVLVLGTVIMILTHGLPKLKRHGPEKDATYESGMEPIGDAKRRFNVKFYLVAMLFLIFDVELIFMYPWAMVFMNAKGDAALAAQVTPLFWFMIVFFVILTIGFIYEWGKGALTYD